MSQIVAVGTDEHGTTTYEHQVIPPKQIAAETVNAACQAAAQRIRDAVDRDET